MLEPPPLEEHWTIWPLPSQSASWPAGPSSWPKKMMSPGWEPPGGGSGPTPRDTCDVCAGVSSLGSRPFAVHWLEVLRPASIPAWASAHRTYIEQSQVVPTGSRLCMSCTEPPRSVGGPRLYVKRPTRATAQASAARTPAEAAGAKAPRYLFACASTASTYV